ncbi:cryptococcal mannosyltransferase 1-domain-containing protein [Aspergillus varians]
MHVPDELKSVIHGLSFLTLSAVRQLSHYPKLRRRLLQLALLTFFFWSTIDVLLVHRHFNQEQTRLDYKPPNRQRIFIASALWNKERTLPGQWNEAVAELANVFGSDNLFVSVYESGSSDGTKQVLHKLDKTLEATGMQRIIKTVSPSPDDEALMSLNPADPRRISYISRLRNKSLKPLYDLRDAGTFFDRILFLSDVVFTKEDVLALLNTNYGTYTAACSFDILKPPSDSDALALRDADGYERVMQKWPFFRSSRSREAVEMMLPVPVRSCWDGMVFMGTEAIYSSRPIQFRGVHDSLAAKHIVASESCLIHADNIISRRRGVYLNPFVRVGHSIPAQSATYPSGHWISTWEIFESIWENRLRRWFSSPFFKGWSLRRRVSAWKAENENNSERGDFCLIDEAQTTTT